MASNKQFVPKNNTMLTIVISTFARSFETRQKQCCFLHVGKFFNDPDSVDNIWRSSPSRKRAVMFCQACKRIPSISCFDSTPTADMSTPPSSLSNPPTVVLSGWTTFPFLKHSSEIHSIGFDWTFAEQCLQKMSSLSRFKLYSITYTVNNNQTY